VELSEIIGPNEEMEHTAKNADFTYEKAFYEASEFRNPECSLTALWAVAHICNFHDRPQAGGYSISCETLKDALESQLRLLDISASIWDCDATVHLPGRSSVFFDSGVRLFCQQRRESFSLRHDAARFCRDETRGHRRRNS
jgi:hypothetical protein